MPNILKRLFSGAEPLTPLTWADGLPSHYPNPNDWKRETPILKRDVFRFAQQWLTEGVPYAFRDEPMVFEIAREAMARKLGISPKHISMTGSARLGHSLGSSFGAGFGENSDLDLFVVSEPLFHSLAIDGRLFARRVRAGEAVPRSAQEREWWNDTADKMELQITERHYIDHKLVPSFDRYPTVKLVSQAIVLFGERLHFNSRTPRDRKVTVRVYRDWDAALRKIGGSIVHSLTQNGFSVVTNGGPTSPNGSV